MYKRALSFSWDSAFINDGVLTVAMLVNFYLRLGCTVAAEPDPELFELEAEDIHLECDA